MVIQQVNEPYELKLYIAGCTPRSLLAIDNFKTLCEDRLQGRYSAEIIDILQDQIGPRPIDLTDIYNILQDPKKARSAQIVATPTLVKQSPGIIRRMVGTLSETDKVLAALDLQPDREEKGN
jgi:circadian clock protein KaiB